MKSFSILVALLMVTSFAKLHAQDPEWKLMHEGNAAFQGRNYERAQACYLRILKKSPQNARAYFNLADTYLAQGDSHRADSLFNKSIQLEKNPQIKSMAYHNLGYIRQQAALRDSKNQQQLLRQAIEHYKQALRLNPNDNDTRYNLVLCQHQLKDSQSGSNNSQKDRQKNPEGKQNQQNQKRQKQQDSSSNNEQDKQQTEQYINLAKQAERDTRKRINSRKPRQRSLEKNW